MAGTTEGGIKARDTNKSQFGDDFYRRIGGEGGKRGNTGGFAAKVVCDCDLVAGSHYKKNCAGVKGGRISRRQYEGV